MLVALKIVFSDLISNSRSVSDASQEMSLCLTMPSPHMAVDTWWCSAGAGQFSKQTVRFGRKETGGGLVLGGPFGFLSLNEFAGVCRCVRGESPR